MKRLIGYHMEIHLKEREDLPYGLLIDVDEGLIYLKESADNKKVCVVPRENINYVIVDNMSFGSDRHLGASPVEPTPPAPSPDKSGIRVTINEEIVAEIVTPPTFNLSEWHENIHKIVLGDHNVQVALQGMVQKSLDYFAPAEDGFALVKLTAEGDDQARRDAPNTFAMGAGGPVASEYLDPLQMVTRLQNVSQGVKK